MNKPGIKTTEFWLALIAMVLVAMPQAFGENAPQWVQVAGIIGAALIAMGYGVSRAISKTGEGQGLVIPMNALQPPVPPVVNNMGGPSEEETFGN